MGSEAGELRLRTTAIRTGVHLVTASGALDRASAPVLARELEQVPAAADVIVDLDEAELADASAFGVLRRFAARLRRQGNELTVVCEGDPGTRTLLREAGVSVADEHDGALRYLLGRRLLKRLRWR
jgi:anti-anti-sigma factor